MAPRQYRVRNWSKFQHYKNRNPPWIKLHVEILSSEDWVSLADASKLLAIACMIIASKNDGMVPDNPEYIQRVAYLEKTPNLKPLIECGFLENLQADASNTNEMLASACPETETETEKRTTTTTDETVVVVLGFDDFFKEMPRQNNRAAAKQAFLKAISKISAHELVEAAKRYSASCKGFEARFIQGPAKWLEEERWEDFPVKANGRAKDPENEAFQKAMREKYGYE